MARHFVLILFLCFIASNISVNGFDISLVSTKIPSCWPSSNLTDPSLGYGSFVVAINQSLGTPPFKVSGSGGTCSQTLSFSPSLVQPLSWTANFSCPGDFTISALDAHSVSSSNTLLLQVPFCGTQHFFATVPTITPGTSNTFPVAEMILPLVNGVNSTADILMGAPQDAPAYIFPSSRPGVSFQLPAGWSNAGIDSFTSPYSGTDYLIAWSGTEVFLAPLPLNGSAPLTTLQTDGIKLDCSGCSSKQFYFLGIDASFDLTISILTLDATDQLSITSSQVSLGIPSGYNFTLLPTHLQLLTSPEGIVYMDQTLYVYSDQLYAFDLATFSLLSENYATKLIQSLAITDDLKLLATLDDTQMTVYNLSTPNLTDTFFAVSDYFPTFPSSSSRLFQASKGFFIAPGPADSYLIAFIDGISLYTNLTTDFNQFDFLYPNGFVHLISIQWLSGYRYLAVFPDQITIFELIPLEEEYATHNVGNLVILFTIFTPCTRATYDPTYGLYVSHGSMITHYAWPNYDHLVALPPSDVSNAIVTVTTPFSIPSMNLAGEIYLTFPIVLPILTVGSEILVAPQPSNISSSDPNCTSLFSALVLETKKLLIYPADLQLLPAQSILSDVPLIRLKLDPITILSLFPKNVDLLNTDPHLPVSQIGGKTTTFCRLVSQDVLQLMYFDGSITNWYQAPSMQCIIWTPLLNPIYSVFDVSAAFLTGDYLSVTPPDFDLIGSFNPYLLAPYVSSTVANTPDRIYIMPFQNANGAAYLTLNVLELAPQQLVEPSPFIDFGPADACSDIILLVAFDDYLYAVVSCPTQTFYVLDAGISLSDAVRTRVVNTTLDAVNFGTIVAIGGDRQFPLLLVDQGFGFTAIILDSSLLLPTHDFFSSVVASFSLNDRLEFLESHQNIFLFRHLVDQSLVLGISNQTSFSTLPVTRFNECQATFQLPGPICGLYASGNGHQILVSNCSHVYLMLYQNQSGYYPHLVTVSPNPSQLAIYATHLENSIAVVSHQSYTTRSVQLIDVSHWIAEIEVTAPPANYNLTLSLVDAETGTFTNIPFNIHLQGPPVFTGKSIPNQLVDADQEFLYNVDLRVFDDPNNDPLLVSATQCQQSTLPSWLSFNPTTSTFLGVPGTQDVGTYCITVRATDGISPGVASTSFFVTVEHFPFVVFPYPNQAVDVSLPSSTLTVPFNTFGDADQATDTLVLSATGMPAWLTLTGWSFLATPTTADIGYYKIKLIATDMYGGSVSTSFTLYAEYFPDVLAEIPPQSAGILQAYLYVVPVGQLFASRDGSRLTYSATTTLLSSKRASSAGGWLSFDPSSATFSGTPLPSDHGTLLVSLIATDTAGGASIIQFNVSVVYFPVAILGQITVPEASVGHQYSYQFAPDLFTDPDSPVDQLTYSLGGGFVPSWISFNSSTRTMSGTPSSSDVGSNDLNLYASDGFGFTPVRFKLVVQVNLPPYVLNPLSSIDVSLGQHLSFFVPSDTFVDPNGDHLTFSITQANNKPVPSWMLINTSIPSISGTPSISDIPGNHLGFIVGPYVVHLRVTASDGNSSAVSTMDVSISGISAVEWALIALLIFFGPAIVLVTLYLIRHYFWYLFCRRRYLKTPVTRSAYERSMIELSGHDLYPIEGYDEGLFTKMEIYLCCRCVCCRFHGKSYPWCKKKLNRGEVKRIEVEVRDPRGFGGDRVPHDVQCWECCVATLTCCRHENKRAVVPPPSGFPAVRRSNRAQWWGNTRLKDMNRRSLPNKHLPEWLYFDRHLNALIIEPKHIINPADLEDEYFISVIGNDKRVRAEFKFTFEKGQGNQGNPSPKIFRDHDDDQHDDEDSTQAFQFP